VAKVDKQKFDAVLKKLLKAQPLKRDDVKTGPKKLGKVIEPQK
jgi:hypothetical protein